MSTSTPRRISQTKTVYRLLAEALENRDAELAQEVHRNVAEWLCDEEEKEALIGLIAQVQDSINDLQDYLGDSDE